MINVMKLSMLLRQTKLIPSKDINKVKIIAKKMNKGQKVNATQKTLFNNVSSKLSMIPMLNNSSLYAMTKKILKKEQKMKEEAEKAQKAQKTQ